jgi:putative oxidoreductase
MQSMSYLLSCHEAVAALVARIFLGLLFFFQGYDAVFRIKMKEVMHSVEGPLAAKGLPRLFIRWGAWFTSYAQLIGGTLLVLGLFRYVTLYVLGLDLLVAAVGFGIAAPVWDTRHVFPRLALLLLLLLVPVSFDQWNLDHLFF